MTLNISMSITQLFDKTFNTPVEKQIETAAGAGFKHLDISFWDWIFYSGSPFRDDRWEGWVDSIKAYIAEKDIIFTQAHAAASIMPEDRHILDGMNVRTIKAASMLGIKWIVFHVLDFPGDYDKAHINKLKEENRREFGRLLEVAEKCKVGIALENMHPIPWKGVESKPDRYCTRTGDLAELVDSLESEYVGICWDVGHGNLVAEDQISSMKYLGKRIKALHIHDNNGLSDQHLMPFYGNVNWEDIIKTLYEIRYEGDFTFEASLFLGKQPEHCKNLTLRLLYGLGEHIVNMK